jgi:hypothetical protein
MKIVNQPTEIDGIRVVQDSEEIADALRHGETVYHWEAGDSMSPMLRHMEYCKIVPVAHPDDVKEGDAVFCKINSDPNPMFHYYMVHQVWQKADFGHDNKTWYKIGSTMTTVFGWSSEVLGKAYGTDIFQEVTQEIKDAWEAERIESEYQQD